MRIFTIVVEMPDDTYEDDTFQNELQIALNTQFENSRIQSTTHTDE